MKRAIPILAFAVFLSLGTGCSSPGEPQQGSGPDIPDSIRDGLTLQAMKLAHNYLADHTFTYQSDTLEVPQWAVDSFRRALEGVWHLISLERDTVVQVYRIEPTCPIDFRSILVTGNIDTAKYSGILRKFSLVLLQSGDNFQFFRSTEKWNTYAVCNAISKSLANQDKVVLEPMGPQGVPGDEITPKFKFDGSIELEYQIGYGDCWQGCIHRRYWTFNVGIDGRASFLGVRGDPPCDPKDRR